MLHLRPAIATALILTCMAALAASADVEIEQEITGYSGAIAPNTGPLKACNHDLPPCAYYCNAKYYAHGKGRVVFFGGEYAKGREWYYNGDFVHGRMEGFGRFETDHFTYEGQFKANQFDGHGTVYCEGIEGWYEGEFAMGRLIGELRIYGKAQTLTWFKPGDYVDRLYGPCLPPRRGNGGT